MDYQDKSLSCRDCGDTFVFTASEQEFFSLKGLTNQPKRCMNCRIVVVDVKCDECGLNTKVTFKPTGRKPVLCLHCMHASRQTADLVPATGAMMTRTSTATSEE